MAAFTVNMPKGMQDFEFSAYLRVLERRGVNVANTCRVIDPILGRRWLHAWTNEAEVLAFVEALKEESEDDQWVIYPLPDVEPTCGPLGPLEIYAVRKHEDCHYTLSSISQRLIRKTFPKANYLPRVSIAAWGKTDFEETQGPLWPQIASILTGLTDAQLEQLGGYRIIDWKEKRVYRDALPLVA